MRAGALVVGASGTIGGAVAAALSRSGYRVFAGWNRSESSARRLAERIRRAGGTAEEIRLDVTKTDSVEQAVATIATHRTVDAAPTEFITLDR